MDTLNVTRAISKEVVPLSEWVHSSSYPARLIVNIRAKCSFACNRIQGKYLTISLGDGSVVDRLRF